MGLSRNSEGFRGNNEQEQRNLSEYCMVSRTDGDITKKLRLFARIFLLCANWSVQEKAKKTDEKSAQGGLIKPWKVLCVKTKREYELKCECMWRPLLNQIIFCTRVLGSGQGSEQETGASKNWERQDQYNLSNYDRSEVVVSIPLHREQMIGSHW